MVSYKVLKDDYSKEIRIYVPLVPLIPLIPLIPVDFVAFAELSLFLVAVAGRCGCPVAVIINIRKE